MPDRKPGEGEGEGRGLSGLAGSFAKEILVPIVLALVVIQFVIQAFKIPSASMEDSLLIGDFLLGLKFVYGSPLPFSDTKLPGLTDPKPGEVLIFRYPGDPQYPAGDKHRYRFLANLFLFGNLYWDRNAAPGEKSLVWYQPKDFIKRCVAQSGDTLTVSGTSLFIDGRESPLPRKGKHKPAETRRYEFQRDSLHFRLPMPGETLDLDTLPLKQAVWMRSLALQENPGHDVELHLSVVKDSVIDSNYVLPYLNGDYRDPSQGGLYWLLRRTVQTEQTPSGMPYMHTENVPFREIQEMARTGFVPINQQMTLPPDTSTGWKRFKYRFSRREEFNEFFMGHYLDLVGLNVAGQGLQAGGKWHIRARIAIDGKESSTYTVKKKCYFMMGDNRDDSSDSRYWGLLSKDFVKAKAFIIYFSFDNKDERFAFTNPLSWLTIPFKIRWSRIGKLID